MRLSALLADARRHAPEAIGAAVVRPSERADPIITSVVQAHQDAEGGALFVARRGERFDAHDHAPAAVARGAVAVVGERSTLDLPVPYVRVADARRALPHLAAALHGHPSRRLRVLGITGTDGKTTTSYLLHAMLADGFRTGLISTAGIRLGSRELPALGHFTTPEATDVQRLLAHFAAEGATHAVLESSSHGFSLHRLDAVEYRAGVVTNLSPEHLDHHKTFAAYLDAKATLLRRSELAVLNADDANYPAFASVARGGDREVITYGQTPSADVRIGAISAVPGGLEFTLVVGGEVVPVKLPMIGAYNAWNTAAAIAAAVAENVTPAAATRALESFTGVPGRMQVIQAEPYTVVLDFAHTAPALEKAIRAVRPQKGRVIVVVGAAGERDPGKRAPLGHTAVRDAELAIFTEEDSRSEAFEKIVEGLVRGATQAGGVAGRNFIVVPDRSEALAEAFSRASTGDVVLLAGKGHERTLERADETIAWDEAALALRLLGVRPEVAP